MASDKNISQRAVLTVVQTLRKEPSERNNTVHYSLQLNPDSIRNAMNNNIYHYTQTLWITEKLNQITQSKVKENHLQIVQFLSNDIYSTTGLRSHTFLIHSLFLSQLGNFSKRCSTPGINVSKFAGIAQQCTRSWVILSAISDKMIWYLYAILLEKITKYEQ